MRLKLILLTALVFCVLDLKRAQAQENSEGQQSLSSEAGFFLGHLLPNQIEGVTEIIPFGGLRYSSYLGKVSHLEFTAASGRGSGVSYNTFDISYRYNAVVEDFNAMAYLGPTLHYYTPLNEKYTIGYGAHVGMGLQLPMSEILVFRVDMKFNLNPGTALFVNFGFSFRLDGGAAGPNES